MVSMLRKRTCILVSMSIPCHICKGKGVSGAGPGAQLGAQAPATARRPPPGEMSRDATNLKEVFEGDALIHLVRPLGAARKKTLRLPQANGAGAWGHWVTRGWVPQSYGVHLTWVHSAGPAPCPMASPKLVPRTTMATRSCLF